MKKLKELKPILDLLKKDKWKFIFLCILLLTVESTSVFSGYLNGSAVEAITNLDLNKSLIYLGIYFIYALVFSGILMIIASNGLIKLESNSLFNFLTVFSNSLVVGKICCAFINCPSLYVKSL